MGDYYLEYRFHIVPREPATEILIAELGELGFESFVETPEGLLAYISEQDWTENLLDQVQIFANKDFSITHERREIPQENWNAVWEQSFEPIEVGDLCVVRAPFHEPRGVKYEIVIEPKMSFGTGHHETTYLILRLLIDLNCEGKTVLDMGCGTGVLAILAAMKGADTIDAVDIDSWSYENTLENSRRNGQERIAVYQGDVSVLEKGKEYSLILANINRNVLLTDIPAYTEHLTSGGLMVLSGFYTEDLPLISQCCEENGLRLDNTLQKNNWQAAVYRLS
ncbi:50S ribosomal protein L11 methyltransferase [Poritiphilus flavus]|uniref:Ribosomal protein L11 methyltransferase n=1 Tax=Poritiphilus flavus TaxID=2697053 RepID=A0A6L9E8R2_9FLAO|nr:50S ribosomal protein L11 methyltransferase [Poritiphilus flavus]NAS11116.1 50S ribosomal protein L11 methyltransferase [Poritiphilus flavus]